jgi:hypothetical protein
VLQVRRDRVELACEVAPAGDDPRHGRVEAVVVAWREVDDGVLQLGGRFDSDRARWGTYERGD